MKLFIKNMDCQCCKAYVKEEFEKAGFRILHINDGEIEIQGIVPSKEIDKINTAIMKMGLLIITSKKDTLGEKIKKCIGEYVHNSKEKHPINFSSYLVESLPFSYAYLARLFVEREGVTIEQYLISFKIKKVKEMILEEYNLTEIAEKLHYSSVAHLSHQFKKITGITPTYFKTLAQNAVDV